jgi:hypothetical protein
VKLLAKLGLMTLLAGAGATAIYAAPKGEEGPQVEQAMIRASQIRSQAADDARHVTHLQQLARKEKDVIKLNCVNDKLVQMKPNLNMIDRAQGEIGAGQVSSLTDMTRASELVRQLREAADQCIGEPILGEESTNSYTHPDIPDPDGTNPWGEVFEPPVYASPMN